jgi:hypothetical protein
VGGRESFEYLDFAGGDPGSEEVRRDVVSEDHIGQSNDCKTDQRRDNRDRGDPIRLLELAQLRVGHITPSSGCSTAQPDDPSKQTSEESRNAEEHKRGHHQKTRAPTRRAARLVIGFIVPQVRTEHGRRQRP